MPKAKRLPSGNYRARIYSHKDVSGRKVYESFTADSAKEAEFMAAEFRLNKNNTDLPRNHTVKEAVQKYIESKNNILSTTTIRGYNTLLNNSFVTIQSLKISKINQSQIQTWVNTLAAERKPKTIQNAHGLLGAVLALYQPNFRIKTTLPMRTKPELYTPSDEDVKALLKHVRGTDIEIAVLLAAYGAMRRGEICALTNKDISGNIISINKSMVRSNEGGFTIKSPKTTSSYRKVEMPPFVIDRIKDIDGKIIKIHPEDISKNFGRILEEAGLPHFRFHDLRHYSASIMHAIGIPDQYIMARGGWKTDRVLKEVYRNVIDGENDKFTKKINHHFEKYDTKDDTK